MTDDERPAYPSAEALRYAHDVSWPNDRIDIARLCERFANEQQLRTLPGADAMETWAAIWRDFSETFYVPEVFQVDALGRRVADAIEQAALAAREEEREFLLGSLLRPDMDDMMAMSRAWESAGGEWSTRASVYMCAALATLARALGQRKPG